jgi:hypothetical protein
MNVVLKFADSTRKDEPAFVRRLRLRAKRRVLWMRALWAKGLAGTEQGLAISHAEVDRILDDPVTSAEAEALFYANDEAARELSYEIDAADSQSDREEKWTWILDEFGLSNSEGDLLSMAAAVELDPWLKRVYGYLNDDATACHATQSLARSLFGWSASIRIGADSALVRWLIARPLDSAGNPWTDSSPWSADPHIVSWLAATDGESLLLDSVLGTAAQFVFASKSAPQSCLYPDQLAAMQQFTHTMRTTGNTAFEIELVAAEGAGKQTLAAQFAGAVGMKLLVVDASLLAQSEISACVESGIRAARLARLTGSVLYWRSCDNVDPRVWRAVAGRAAVTVIGSASPLAWQRGGPLRRSFQLPARGRQHRVALWNQLAGTRRIDGIPSPVSEWMLTPGEIANAARAASAGEDALADIFRQMVHRSPGELFSPLPCPYTWDDIVLPANLREHLKELETQAWLRSAVYEDWGFDRLFPLGGGITALFAGPSGTGKTMAAQVLARSLSMELFRVDLAGVMNKYIGETEKRLKQVFEVCERANVMLFFDEADALFGQRTQVKDAHDRYANIQVDYLLQRMEQFDGIAILATNRKSDLDNAFLRRIRFIIDFLSPGPAERLALWQLALPERSPAGEALLDHIDWDFLATKLAMTGADIKAAALSAAFRARSQSARIGMKHILDAARREMTKHGISLRPGDLEEVQR